jgi:beta-glucanase (GH16 family)
MKLSFYNFLMMTPLCCVCVQATAQTLLWSEEFNYTGAPDSKEWSYDYGNWGWGNQELQNYTNDSANVRVDGSNLVITAVREGNSFTSARIKTLDKLTFKYGTVEARIQTPDLADGLWPAFWTLGNDFPSVGWPDCGEIDIMEMGNAAAIAANKINRRVGSTAHWEYNNSYAGYGTYEDRPFDINGAFVVYRMEWTPSLIKTYIDGIKIWEMDISQRASGDLEEFHVPHFFLLNMAVGGTYTGIFDAGGVTAPFPAEYKVDWIRIYDNGFTELGGTSLKEDAVSGTNLLVNAGFESGTTGWDLNLSGGLAWASPDYAQGGTASMVIDSTGAGGWSAPNASQSFPADPGDVFNMQGYMLNPAGVPVVGSSFGLFKIEFRNSTGTVLGPAAVDLGTAAAYPYYGTESRPFLDAGSAPDNWIFSRTQAEAPAGTAWVSFILLNVNQPENPGPMYFDDIQAILVGELEQPFSLEHAMDGGDIRIRFPTQTGIRYNLIHNSSLTNANWTLVDTIIGNGATNSIAYPMTDSAGFYKIIVP